MALLLVGSLICGAFAHGRMTDPPSRNHLFKTEWDKDGLWSETNRCGSSVVTKKHYDQWATKEFNVEKTLTAGQIITVSLLIKVVHIGKHWFEFACMDGMLDLVTGHKDVSWKKVVFDNGQTETGKDECQSEGTCTFKIRVPKVNCKHGVLNWNWMAVHNTPREWFRNCADVQITGGTGTRPVKTTTATPRPVKTTTATPRPVTATSATPRPMTTTTATPRPMTTTTASPRPVTTTTATSPPVAITTASPRPVTATTSTSPPLATTTASPPSETTTGSPTTDAESKTSSPFEESAVIGVIIGVVALAFFCIMCAFVAKKRNARKTAEVISATEAEKARRAAQAEERTSKTRRKAPKRKNRKKKHGSVKQGKE